MSQEMMTNIDPYQASGTFCMFGCPYFDRQQMICRAATRLLTPGLACQASYCKSDDYDDCPLYLCQALRSSQPLGRDRETITSSGK